MGARIKKKRKGPTRRQKIAESKRYLTCKSERTPKKLIDALNAIEIKNAKFKRFRDAKRRIRKYHETQKDSRQD